LAVYVSDAGELRSDGGAGAGLGDKKVTVSGGKNAPTVYVVTPKVAASETFLIFRRALLVLEVDHPEVEEKKRRLRGRRAYLIKKVDMASVGAK